MQDCTICLEGIDPKSGVALSCGHTFHPQCIVSWLQQCGTGSCPTCRDTGHAQGRRMADPAHAAFVRLAKNYQGRRTRLCSRQPQMRELRDRVRAAHATLREAEQHLTEIHSLIMQDARLKAARENVRLARRGVNALEREFNLLTESHLGPAPHPVHHTLRPP